MANKEAIGGISCRSVGPGGTVVVFYPTPMGIECVWTNENCPYLKDGTAYPGQRVVTADKRDAASDGHNVSLIPWADVLAWAALAPKA